MNLFHKLKKFITKENPVREVLRQESGVSVDDLETALITSDVSANLAQEICQGLSLKKPFQGQILEKIQKKLARGETEWDVGSDTVILFIGVNGSGKTTTVAKVASYLSKRGSDVVLCGADSFRAGAGEQLRMWAEKLNLPAFIAEQGTDACSTVYKVLTNSHDKVVLVDTSGRQTTQKHLMDEMSKIWRVTLKLKGKDKIKVILVLDAFIGSSAPRQVEAFQEHMKINGVIMNKMDTSAKGGTLLEIVDKFQLPIYCLGTGEKLEDLCHFSPKEFARSICGI